jgi:hypothetical protein
MGLPQSGVSVVIAPDASLPVLPEAHDQAALWPDGGRIAVDSGNVGGGNNTPLCGLLATIEERDVPSDRRSNCYFCHTVGKV